jgi:GTP-binding protein
MSRVMREHQPSQAVPSSVAMENNSMWFGSSVARFEQSVAAESQLANAFECELKIGTQNRQLKALMSRRAQVAVLGRSNVGKSSLLNALMGTSEQLALTSGTPGRTRALNLFSVGSNLTLIDNPGYGFVKRGGVAESDAWLRLMALYLTAVRDRCAAWILVDARRGFCKLDEQCLQFLAEHDVRANVALTKADKVSGADLPLLEARVDEARQHLRRAAGPLGELCSANQQIVLTSARLSSGIDELRAAMLASVGLTSPPLSLAQNRRSYSSLSSQSSANSEPGRRCYSSSSSPPQSNDGDDVVERIKQLLVDEQRAADRECRDLENERIVALVRDHEHASSGSVRKLLAEVYLAVGDYLAAIDVSTELLAAAELPDDALVGMQLLRGECYHRYGDLASAEVDCRAVALAAVGTTSSLSSAQRGIAVAALRRLGFVLLERAQHESGATLADDNDDDDDSTDKASSGSESESDADSAPRRRRRLDLKSSRLHEVLESFERAAELDPDDVELPYGMALALMRQQQFDGALEHLTRALAIDDKYAPALHKAAECCHVKKRYAEAISYYTRFIDEHHAYYSRLARHDDRLAPSEVLLSDAVLKRGICYVRNDEAPLAEIDFSAVVDLDQHAFVAFARHYRGAIALERGDYEQCVDENTEALERHATLLPAIRDRAAAYEALDRHEEASIDRQLLSKLSASKN